jgi:hypothetical protein
MKLAMFTGTTAKGLPITEENGTREMMERMKY